MRSLVEIGWSSLTWGLKTKCFCWQKCWCVKCWLLCCVGSLLLSAILRMMYSIWWILMFKTLWDQKWVSASHVIPLLHGFHGNLSIYFLLLWNWLQSVCISLLVNRSLPTNMVVHIVQYDNTSPFVCLVFVIYNVLLDEICPSVKLLLNVAKIFVKYVHFLKLHKWIDDAKMQRLC